MKAKPRNVLLHAGLPKTATTSIQVTCGKNVERLKDAGFYFPIFNFDGRQITNHTIPLLGLLDDHNHVNLRWGVDPQRARAVYHQQMLDLVGIDEKYRFLLSAEGVSVWGRKRLMKLKEYLSRLNLNAQVVVVARDPIDWAQSQVQQHVKLGKTLESVNIISLANNLQNCFKRLEEVFGPSLRVLDFQKLKQHKFGVVSGFLSELGIDDALLDSIDYRRVNESWSYDAIRMASYINRVLPIFDGNALGSGRLDKDIHVLSELHGDPFEFDFELYTAAKEIMAPVSDYLGKKYEIAATEHYYRRPRSWSGTTAKQLTEVIERLPTKELISAACEFLYREAKASGKSSPMLEKAIKGLSN